MNPLLKRALGESSSDVVPVLANLPRDTYRKRMQSPRARRGAPAESKQLSDADAVRRMVGEAAEDDYVIPDDAEDVSATEMTVGKPLREPKDIVQEPSHPTADKEKLNTPYAALTAPDVTPQSTQPIDPSKVPGAAGPEKFTAADLKSAPEAQKPNNEVNPMDILLGHNRASKPAANTEEFAQAGAITTEEGALRALGITAPLAEAATAKAANALTPGGEMPPPAQPGDGAAIYSAFRRFNG